MIQFHWLNGFEWHLCLHVGRNVVELLLRFFGRANKCFTFVTRTMSREVKHSYKLTVDEQVCAFSGWQWPYWYNLLQNFKDHVAMLWKLCCCSPHIRFIVFLTELKLFSAVLAEFFFLDVYWDHHSFQMLPLTASQNLAQILLLQMY